jgi:hypothetical protein
MSRDEENGIAEFVHVLACVECPRVASANAKGWRAVRVDLPDEGDEPAVPFYCPECGEREFG